MSDSATPWTVLYQAPPSMGFSILEWDMRSPLKKGKFGYRREHKENTAEDEGGNQSDATASQGMAKIPNKPPQEEEAWRPSRTHPSNTFCTSGVQNYDTIMSVV